MVERVLATDDAIALIVKLTRMHGPLMFHQSGGCCDGSSPMCYPAGEFRVGGNDTYLGEIGGCPVYMDADQFAYWKHTQLIIDVVPGFPDVAAASLSKRRRACGFSPAAACSPTKR